MSYLFTLCVSLAMAAASVAVGGEDPRIIDPAGPLSLEEPELQGLQTDADLRGKVDPAPR